MKKVHRSWAEARLHQLRVRVRFGDRVQVYQCRWHDDYRLGATAKRHWHVGHGPLVR